MTELPDQDKGDLLVSIKEATDGIQFAIQAATNKDYSRMLKGIGDAVAVLPGVFGYAGVAFSLAASAFAFLGGGSHDDPVLAALSKYQEQFNQQMTAIQTELQGVNDKLHTIITGIDRILKDISDIPSRVVAEMKLTELSEMKDKFDNVQRCAMQYAQGNMTREQMVSKCDDFDVASLFSELETILKDDANLFTAKFGAEDLANGQVQIQLLVFYLSVIPLATNCNSLKYSIGSIQDDGSRIQQIINTVFQRASWLLTPPDRSIHVQERFSPFETRFADDGNTAIGDGFHHALSFKAFSFMPSHGVCFKILDNLKHLVPFPLEPRKKVPQSNVFCVKSIATDDCPNRIAYAERDAWNGSIIQPEANETFDALNGRGWNKSALAFYSPKFAFWKRLPLLTLVSDFVIMQAESKSVSLEDVSHQCESMGSGYIRDGDGHSKDYKGAPWTIFCVKYQENLTLRELIQPSANRFLADMQLNDMKAGDAWTATCPDEGYTRDKNNITIPSQIKSSWLAGTSTRRSYAVCLNWHPVLLGDAPNKFMRRVWIDDSASMPDKPKSERNNGSEPMALPAAPSQAELDAF